MTSAPIVAILVGLVLATPAIANDPIDTLTNGQPWTATMPDGNSMMMTFNPDGTGHIQVRSMSRRISWALNGDQFCLSGMPRSNGPSCAVPIEIDGGFQLSILRGLKVQLRR